MPRQPLGVSSYRHLDVLLAHSGYACDSTLPAFAFWEAFIGGTCRHLGGSGQSCVHSSNSIIPQPLLVVLQLHHHSILPLAFCHPCHAAGLLQRYQFNAGVLLARRGYLPPIRDIPLCVYYAIGCRARWTALATLRYQRDTGGTLSGWQSRVFAPSGRDFHHYAPLLPIPPTNATTTLLVLHTFCACSPSRSMVMVWRRWRQTNVRAVSPSVCGGRDAAWVYWIDGQATTTRRGIRWRRFSGGIFSP